MNRNHYVVRHERVDNNPRLKRVTVKYFKGGSAAVITDHSLNEEEMHDLKMKAKVNTRLYGDM